MCRLLIQIDGSIYYRHTHTHTHMRTQAVDAFCCDPPVVPLLQRRRDADRKPHTSANVGGIFRGSTGELDLDGLHGAMRDCSSYQRTLQQWFGAGAQELDVGLRLPAELAALLVRGSMPVLPYNIGGDFAKARGGLEIIRRLCLSSERRVGDDEDDESNIGDMGRESCWNDDGDDDASDDGGSDLDFDPWNRTWVWDAQLTADLSSDLAAWSSSILQDKDDETVMLLSTKLERYISWSMNLTHLVNLKFGD